LAALRHTPTMAPSRQRCCLLVPLTPGRYRIADRWCVKPPEAFRMVSLGRLDVDMSRSCVPDVSPCLLFHGSLLRVLAHSGHTGGRLRVRFETPVSRQEPSHIRLFKDLELHVQHPAQGLSHLLISADGGLPALIAARKCCLTDRPTKLVATFDSAIDVELDRSCGANEPGEPKHSAWEVELRRSGRFRTGLSASLTWAKHPRPSAGVPPSSAELCQTKVGARRRWALALRNQPRLG
jgi:hypothetical protein